MTPGHEINGILYGKNEKHWFRSLAKIIMVLAYITSLYDMTLKIKFKALIGAYYYVEVNKNSRYWIWE